MSDGIERKQQLRKLIADFLQQRRDEKLEKLAADDPKRDALVTQFQHDTWLSDAARRVGQLQVVTHTLKAVHPDAKGSNLFVQPAAMPDRIVVGSHNLNQGYASDVVGNAAALDVYKFLKLSWEGHSLLSLMQAEDVDLLAALSDDTKQAKAWAASFAAITQSSSAPVSHTCAKQVYWLWQYDPCDDTHYHLLSPLYASALSHRVYQTIQEHRFSEEAKAARQARREGKPHPHGYSDYPHLAEEIKGGTKPQNISQLNSERKGRNYLLASLPPSWDSKGLTPVYRSESALNRFGRRPEVRRLLRELRRFLEEDPARIKPTRDHRQLLLDEIFNELVLFSAEIVEGLPAGWTADGGCKLVIDEQCWLDPWRAAEDVEFNKIWQWRDWPQQIAARFGRWLNSQMGDKLAMGEIESRHWARELGADRDWQVAQDGYRRRLNAVDKARRQQGGTDAA